MVTPLIHTRLAKRNKASFDHLATLHEERKIAIDPDIQLGYLKTQHCSPALFTGSEQCLGSRQAGSQAARQPGRQAGRAAYLQLRV
jgi:hypothetical protein